MTSLLTPPESSRESSGAGAHGRLEFDEPVEAGIYWIVSDAALDIALRGEVDAWVVHQVQPILLDLLVLWQPSRVVIDLSRVTFADASAVGMLVQVDRLATINAAEFRLAAPGVAVVRVLGLCELLDQFVISNLPSTGLEMLRLMERE